jgi:uncharacterized protein (DUF1697 family)
LGSSTAAYQKTGGSVKYVAFLRGINVGGRNIKMADLTACFEDLKFKAVRTILASGNVIFESEETDLDRLTASIESGLTKTFNYPAKVMVRSIDSLKMIVDQYPFDPDPEKHSYIVFLSSPIGQELLDVATMDSKTEQAVLDDGVIYWQVQKGRSLDSTLASLLSKAKYKKFNTVRNLNTLNRIVDGHR